MYVGSPLYKSDGNIASIISLVDGDEVVTLRYALTLIIAYYFVPRGETPHAQALQGDCFTSLFPTSPLHAS